MTMDTHRSQSGSILIYAILVMASMLALSLALSGILVTRLQVSRLQSNSVVAVYVADSAVERCLYEARKLAPAAPTPAPLTFQGSPAETYTLTSASAVPKLLSGTATECNGLNGGTSFKFRAVGIFQGVQRSVEINQ